MSAGGSPGPDTATILHASCVSAFGQGVLILGASGAGKSTLALELLARGAGLVADDRTHVQRRGAGLIARCPDAIRGRIEARGIGILAAQALDSALLRLVIDLDTVETDRLPPPRELALLGTPLPLLRRVDGPHFPAAILQYLKGGRCA